MTGFLFCSLTAVVAVDRRPTLARCGCWGSIDIETPKSGYLTRNSLLLGAVLLLIAAGTGASATSHRQAAVELVMAFPFALLVLELPHILHIAGVGRQPAPLVR